MGSQCFGASSYCLQRVLALSHSPHTHTHRERERERERERDRERDRDRERERERERAHERPPLIVPDLRESNASRNASPIKVSRSKVATKTTKVDREIPTIIGVQPLEDHLL